MVGPFQHNVTSNGPQEKRGWGGVLVSGVGKGEKALHGWSLFNVILSFLFFFLAYPFALPFLLFLFSIGQLYHRIGRDLENQFLIMALYCNNSLVMNF